jgi:hypothetical protein
MIIINIKIHKIATFLWLIDFTLFKHQQTEIMMNIIFISIRIRFMYITYVIAITPKRSY